MVCRALLAELPPRIRDLRSAPVTAGPEQNAAYGDPPITAGLRRPRADPTSRAVDDPTVLAPLDESRADTWTSRRSRCHGADHATTSREVPVQVDRPEAYAAAGPVG